MTEELVPEAVERLLNALDEVHEAAQRVVTERRTTEDGTDRPGTTRGSLRLMTMPASRPAGESTSG